MEAPRRRAADPTTAAIAQRTAELLYPAPDQSLGSVIKYEKDIVKLRKIVIQQRKGAIEAATQRNEQSNWSHRIIEQGPWNPSTDPVSLDGAPSLPMPVEIAESETLAPFFEHLRLGGTQDVASSPRAMSEAMNVEEPYYKTETLEFEKGVVYSDRRMDLCKMVLGPTNIGNLLESLKTNKFITHFLLGNNIIGPHGAKCIADFLKEYPNHMETWYLAGNCITNEALKLIVDELVHSSAVTNVWLKRNPLGPKAAQGLFQLITETPNLRTLDLDQTELGDVGVTELFTELSLYGEKVPLRHIYLNALGVGSKGATAIASFLSSPHCELESLYLSNNPMGSPGIEALAAGVKNNKSLKRLTLASVGMGDDGAIALCTSLFNHPTMMTLDLGQSYATPDLGTRYNWITDRSAPDIKALIETSNLAYLNLGQTALTNTGLNEILPIVAKSKNLLYFVGKTIWPQSREAPEIKQGQRHVLLGQQAHEQLTVNVKRVYGVDYDYFKFMSEEKRWLVNDKDVRKIDSVYRNRDAGLARRGLKKLDKWWDEDDETLQEVMKAVGPVCTKKKMVKAVGPTCAMRKDVDVASS